MVRIAEFRSVSNEYLLAEAVIDSHREAYARDADELELLDRQLLDWRERLARAEMMAAVILARAAGLSWPMIVQLQRAALGEVHHVEQARGIR